MIFPIIYEKEIIELGKDIQMPPISPKTLKVIIKKYKNILMENNYKIVHCNMANAAHIFENC